MRNNILKVYVANIKDDDHVINMYCVIVTVLYEMSSVLLPLIFHISNMPGFEIALHFALTSSVTKFVRM